MNHDGIRWVDDYPPFAYFQGNYHQVNIKNNANKNGMHVLNYQNQFEMISAINFYIFLIILP